MMARMPHHLIVCTLVLLAWSVAVPESSADQPRTRQLPVQFVPRTASQTTGRAAAVAERSPTTANPKPLSSGQPIPLPPPQSNKTAKSPWPGNAPHPTRHSVALVVTSSLAIVLGLFFLVVWISRRALPKANHALPTDALEVLGRAPLATRHNLQLIRLGHRLLLVSVSPDTARTLIEITDPDEVNDLVALCKQNEPGSITASFRQVLQQMNHGEN